MKIKQLGAAASMTLVLATSPLVAAPLMGPNDPLGVLTSDFDQTQRMMKREPAELSPGSEYTLLESDTLRTLAKRSYGNTPLNQEIIRKLIYDLNRKAFFRNNPDFPITGKVIRIPNLNDVRDYVFTYEAGTKYPYDSPNSWSSYP